MKKVVIIDDNPVAVKSLCQTINWDALQCAVSGTALDGEAGKRLVLEVMPDILLLDIQMPGIDGLSMLEEVRDTLPDCKVIIITSYDHFQYASRAIRLSVFDYVLKPIRNAKLEEVIKRAVEELDASLRQRADEMERAVNMNAQIQLFSLLTNESHSGQDVHQLLMDAGLHSECFFIMLAIPTDRQQISYAALSVVDDMLRSCNARAATLLLFDAVVIYVMPDGIGEGWRDTARLIARRLHAELPAPACIGVSDLTFSHHQIRHAYQQARQALWELTFKSGEELGFWREDSQRSQDTSLSGLQKRIEQLAEAADIEDDSSACEAAHAINELGGRQSSNLRALISIYMMLLCKKHSRDSSEDIDRERSTALFINNEQEAAECLTRLHKALRAPRLSAQYSLTTRSAIEYIRIHAAENLRLGDIANHLHLSPNYLSILIKRETDISFYDHYISAKMDIAYALLKDPRLHVSDVASAVGYSNYISFYNAFKAKAHMTPTEYRNKVVPRAERSASDNPDL